MDKQKMDKSILLSAERAHDYSRVAIDSRIDEKIVEIENTIRQHAEAGFQYCTEQVPRGSYARRVCDRLISAGYRVDMIELGHNQVHLMISWDE